MCNKTKVCLYQYNTGKLDKVCPLCLANLDSVKALDAEFDEMMDNIANEKEYDEIFADMMTPIITEQYFYKA